MTLDIRITTEVTGMGYVTVTAKDMDTGDKIESIWEPDEFMTVRDVVHNVTAMLIRKVWEEND